MKLLKQFFNFYIDSSVHVSLAVCCLQAIIMIKYCSIINNSLLYFTFFSSLLAYNLIKYSKYIIDNYYNISYKLKIIAVISIFSLFLSLFFAFSLSLYEIILVLFAGMITLLYAIPIFLVTNNNLRAVKGLKIYLVALVWTIITVLSPLEYYRDFGLLFILITFIQIFIYVLIAIIPFEIRDIDIDDKRLSTIPQKIGVKNTKVLGILMILFLVLFELLKIELNTINNLSLDVFIVSFIMIFLIINSKKGQSKFYSSFWVEGVPILWVLLLLF
jgi:hypothetical protein